MGGWVSGYSIISELHAEGVEAIVLLDDTRSVASRSNKLEAFQRVEAGAHALLEALRGLRQRFDLLVPFPTRDIQLEQLLAIRAEVKDFCFLPLNPRNLQRCLDKGFQVDAARRLGVPCPLSRRIDRPEDFDRVAELPFPVVLKPVKRDDLRMASLARNRVLRDAADCAAQRDQVARHLARGVRFLASEVIPGDGSHIYAYTAFRSADGEIAAEWIGGKLSQHPNDFGVFASASNRAPEVVREQGRTLLRGLDLHGIAEPEFKLDERDGRCKLMEINLRSMMWNHVGYLSGVALHYAVYCHAVGRTIPRRVQRSEPCIHFVFLNNELANLVSRRGYLPTFWKALRGGDRLVLALWDRRDPAVFLASLRILAVTLAKRSIKACLAPFRTG